jgi:hypothetical protein
LARIGTTDITSTKCGSITIDANNIYIVDDDFSKLYRLNKDGTGGVVSTQTFSSGGDTPYHIFLSKDNIYIGTKNRKIYIVPKSNLNTSTVPTLTGSNSDIYGIYLDFFP